MLLRLSPQNAAADVDTDGSCGHYTKKVKADLQLKLNRIAHMAWSQAPSTAGALPIQTFDTTLLRIRPK